MIPNGGMRGMTKLVWDPDVNPEGISESLNFDISDSISIFSNLGQWFIEELKIKDSDRDPTLLVFQLGTQIKPSKKIKFELAGTYYDFKNLDELKWGATNLKRDTFRHFCSIAIPKSSEI